jgi:hypothetical protein
VTTDPRDANADAGVNRDLAAAGASRRPLSLTQRIVLRVLRSRAAEIERESRAWFVVCPNCGLARSFWDLGGVRYKARSRGKWIRMRCRACGKRAMHPVEHGPIPPASR